MSVKSKTKKSLHEGTSNFGRLKNFPLLVFYTYDEVLYAMDNDENCPQYDDYTNEDEYYAALDEYQEKYLDGIDICVLDEEALAELQDTIDEFNSNTVYAAESLYDRYADEEDEDGYSDYVNLGDIKLSIESGYYSGAYIDCENENQFKYLSDKVRQEQLNRFKKFFADLKKNFGLTELGVSYQFSNGETGYHKVDEAVEEVTLPKVVEFNASEVALDADDEDASEILSDLLSDTYGYCHFGFDYEVIRNENGEPSKYICKNIEWDTSESLSEDKKDKRNIKLFGVGEPSKNIAMFNRMMGSNSCTGSNCSEALEDSNEYYECEVGVLLQEDDVEYDAYKSEAVYGGKYSFYDENQFAFMASEFEEWKNSCERYVREGVNRTYAIIKGPFICDEYEAAMIQEDGYLDRYDYDIKNVIFSLAKIDNKIEKDFLTDGVEEALTPEEEKQLRTQDNPHNDDEVEFKKEPEKSDVISEAKDEDSYWAHYDKEVKELNVSQEEVNTIIKYADEYEAEADRGWITPDQIEKYSNLMGLAGLSDEELSRAWEVYYAVLSREAFSDEPGSIEKYKKYSDAASAFAEIINREARNRRERKNKGFNLKAIIGNNYHIDSDGLIYLGQGVLERIVASAKKEGISLEKLLDLEFYGEKEGNSGYLKLSFYDRDVKNLYNKDLKEDINSDSKWNEVFLDFLRDIEFELVKCDEETEEGIWALIDLQGGNLGDIESDRFNTAEDIADRLSVYIDDYYLGEEALEYIVDKEDMPEDGLYSCEQVVNWYTTEMQEKYPDAKTIVDICDLIANHCDEVDLNKVYELKGGEDTLTGSSIFIVMYTQDGSEPKPMYLHGKEIALHCNEELAKEYVDALNKNPQRKGVVFTYRREHYIPEGEYNVWEANEVEEEISELNLRSNADEGGNI
jgi:hypothetical protein